MSSQVPCHPGDIESLMRELRAHGASIGISPEAVDAIQAELHRSEQRYRVLFEAIGEGFGVCEVLYDSAGRPVDCSYVEINPAFEKLTGLGPGRLIGASLRQAIPEIEQARIDALVKVALSGEPARFETYIPRTGRWLEVLAFSPARGQCAHVLVDVTERKMAEQALRHQAGLLQMLKDVATAANAAQRPDEAFDRALQAVLAFTGWGMGATFVQGEDGLLHTTLARIGEGKSTPAMEHYAELARTGTFRPGYGLPGVAFAAGRPIWGNVDELLAKPDLYPYAQQIADAGIRMVLAFPVLAREEVAAVLVFGSTDVVPPDQQLLTLMANVGVQLGRVIERARSRRLQQEREEALRESQDRFALAQQAGRMGVFDWDLATNRVIWTPELEAVFAIPVGSFEQNYEGWASRVHPADLVRLLPFFDEWMQSTRSEQDFEFRFYRADGQLRWMSARGRIIRDDAGRPLRMIGTNADITERKHAEEALWQSRQMLRLVLDSIPDRVFWKDRQSVYIGCNQAFAQDAACMSAAQASGRTDLELGFPEAEKYRHDDREVMQSGQPKLHYEEQQTTPGAETRWIRTSKVPLRDPSGGIIGVLGTYEDITERKRAEQERTELLLREQKARAEAEAANKRKDQFLAVLSHELRTPLTPVLARVELMKRHPDITAELRAGLEMIRRNVELEVRVIDDLLDISKVVRGKLQLDVQVTDAHAAVEEAVSIHQREIEAKNLHLEFHLGAQRHYVRADPVRLRQIFWNLISNAVKYTPAGGRITVTTSDEDDTLKVEVTDTGIGIDPAIMPRLFTAFEQGEQTLARRYGGLGLGLSITKSLVTLHAGSIEASSPGTGKGSTFTVRLQALEGVVAPPAPAAPPPQPTGQPHLKILLVEDNEDTQRMLTWLLQALGHEVTTAGTAGGAAQAATSQQFDLLISNIGLPDQTGWDLMKNLRASKPIPGIAISGFAQADDVRRSREAGFLAHLAKPVDVQVLQHAILAASSGKSLISP